MFYSNPIPLISQELRIIDSLHLPLKLPQYPSSPPNQATITAATTEALFGLAEQNGAERNVTEQNVVERNKYSIPSFGNFKMCRNNVSIPLFGKWTE